MNPLRLAVLASGGGSNFSAILAAIHGKKLDAQVELVVSNRADAGALEIARQNNISFLHLAREQFHTDAELDAAFLNAFEKCQVELIVLAGYLKQISPALIKRFRHRILNIHPGLLPSFGGKGMYGLNVHRAVLDYGCRISGVTVHLIDEEYDSGPIVMQRCVPVKPEDTAENLAARVLKEEHRIYAEAIQLFAEDKIRVEGRRVLIREN